MTWILLIIMAFFWLLLIYFSILTVSGVWFRSKKSKEILLEHYPSVAILIPAHNEGVVIKDTLYAMSKLKYPGELNIYVLDDSSIDDTAIITKEYARTFKHIHYVSVPQGTPKGKSRVLNYGLEVTDSDYFLVYDADNQPEENAVLYLVHAAETEPNSAGAVGYVKTINANTNILTRMITIEFQVFQLLMQAGRWAMFKAGSLTGTNMLLRREVIEQLNGYDVYALAEDAELTIRITSKGLNLPIVPMSVTWEQEPENFKTLVKQRSRWLTGNIYLLEKVFTQSNFWKSKTLVHTIQHLSTYLVFILFLIFSHTWFVLGLIGFDLPFFEAPIIFFWFLSYVVYTAQVLSAMTLDRNVSPMNIFIGSVMYFTYAQVFVVLLIKSLLGYIWKRVKNETIDWDKTTRFKGGAA